MACRYLILGPRKFLEVNLTGTTNCHVTESKTQLGFLCAKILSPKPSSQCKFLS